MRTILTVSLLALLGLPAWGATPRELLDGYTGQAKQEQPAYAGSDAGRGDQFYHALRAKPGRQSLACASCHTADPMKTGSHESTGKSIAPLAPAANAERFSDAAKVEKWFRRNCQDVLGRPCSSAEKADFLAYVTSRGAGSRP